MEACNVGKPAARQLCSKQELKLSKKDSENGKNDRLRKGDKMRACIYGIFDKLIIVGVLRTN